MLYTSIYSLGRRTFATICQFFGHSPALSLRMDQVACSFIPESFVNSHLGYLHSHFNRINIFSPLLYINPAICYLCFSQSSIIAAYKKSCNEIDAPFRNPLQCKPFFSCYPSFFDMIHTKTLWSTPLAANRTWCLPWSSNNCKQGWFTAGY